MWSMGNQVREGAWETVEKRGSWPQITAVNYVVAKAAYPQDVHKLELASILPRSTRAFRPSTWGASGYE